MKKAITLILALALALSMASFCFAEEPAVLAAATKAVADAKADFEALTKELTATIGLDELTKAFNDTIAGLQKDGLLPADLETVDAEALADGTAATAADKFISLLNLEGTDLEAKIQGAFSNDFVSFIAGLYTGDVIVETTTAAPTTTATPATVAPKPPTGSNATIAIATFAVLSLAAGAAFVSMKKKEA